MGSIVVSGSASGIGAALRARCESDGHRVIGVDLRDAEIETDLGTPAGRAVAIEAVNRQCDGGLDGIVACAGVGPQTVPTSAIVAINFFGATALLEGLRPSLIESRQAAAVAVSSNSATIVPGADGDLCAACLDGDETRALSLATSTHGSVVYAAAKLALARWVRRQAVTQAWAGSGIRLNAVAPGAVQTPLLQGGLDHPILGDAIRNFPIPLGRFGQPHQIAAAIAFLLGPEASFCCGAVLYVDGGSEALVRSERVGG